MRARIRNAVICVWAILVCLGPLAVQAHSGGAPLVTDEPAGPYRLFAWTQPDPLRVGDVHLDLAVTLPPPPSAPSTALTEPVTDAAVRVTFTPADAPEQAVVALATPSSGLNGFYYELNVKLDQAAEWRIAVDVAGQAGEGSLEVTRQVLPARQVNWPLIAGASTAVVALIGLIGVWNRLQAKE